MKTRKINIGSLLILFSIAYSQVAYSDMIIEAGFHLGGDELIQESYTNGETGSLKAGNMFSFDFGPLKQFSESFEAQLTLGIKSDVIYSGDVEVSWIRYPLNALFFYRAEKYRLGLGATYHLSPKVKGQDFASNVSQAYKNALGALLEIDFDIKPGFMWGLRYTRIDYETEEGDRVVDGNSLGILIIAQL